VYRAPTSLRSRWITSSVCAIAVVTVIVFAVTLGFKGHTTTLVTTTTAPPLESRTAPSLVGSSLKSSVASDALFLSEVTEVDPALVQYEKKSGNVALRSLLTNGSAFCAFLRRSRDIDTAMVSVVVGARHVEGRTHLPMTVTTFNAVDSVALLTLCPSLVTTVPASDRVRIRALGATLTGASR
jgi:hypothetical protein